MDLKKNHCNDGLTEKSESAPSMMQRSTNLGDPWGNKYGKLYLELPLEEKRKLYRYEHITLKEIPIWSVHSLVQPYEPQPASKVSKIDLDFKDALYDICQEINNKVSLWQGDITRLELDAIVNAANQSLLGGGGVDGSIHRGAGPTLKEECKVLNGCHTGEAKITSGHRLPAKYVIHTVGPVGKSPFHLNSCYESALRLMLDFKIRSIAFCCIATGVYGYPNRDAAYIALRAVRIFMEKYHQEVDRIVFCTYISSDFEIYRELMSTKYFRCKNSPKIGVEDDEYETLYAQSKTDDHVVSKLKKEPTESFDHSEENVHQSEINWESIDELLPEIPKNKHKDFSKDQSTESDDDDEITKQKAEIDDISKQKDESDDITKQNSDNDIKKEIDDV